MKTILWANEVTQKDVPSVGGKGANLGEMIGNNFPVPDAFIVSADAYWKFLRESGLKDKIFSALEGLDVNNSNELMERSKKIRKIFESGKVPWDLELDIINAYKKISKNAGKTADFVAVRSSATAEDLPEASFAGQQETYLNIRGEEDLLEKVRKCWSSLFTPRAIFYREKQGFDHTKVALAVVIQRMVNSEISGVMFTSDPVTGEPKIVIEAGFGLGEAIVGGEITPDTYIVDQKSLQIVDKKVSPQNWMYTRSEEGTSIKLDLPDDTGAKQKLSNELIIKVGKAGRNIEKHYGEPMDVEWCVEANNVYIVQARPVTTIKKETAAPTPAAAEQESAEMGTTPEGETGTGEILLKGLSASPGVVGGKVTIISDINELDRVKDGDIMVTVMTTPDMVPAMKRADGIVTDKGGSTCHAAIVSRELGIPCIVGTEAYTDYGKATDILRDEQEITVDAKLGVVYDGIQKAALDAKEAAATPWGVSVADVVPVTGTKVYMNLGVPDAAEKYAHLPAAGVGLMREEFIVGTYVKAHPNALIDAGESQKFIDILAEGAAKVAKAFFPRPVVMRTSDFKTNEYRELPGGEKYEPEEANPMIGWRGCSRYVKKEFEEAFRLEVRAILKVRNEMGLTNLWVMLPFVRTLDETKRIIEIMKEEGLERSKDFKLWLMAELPCNIFLADKFGEMVDGFSIGSNDLTQLIMGADRDSDILARMGYFDERNEAILRAIEHLIKVAHSMGKTVSICGQAPSVYPEFTEFLVRNGIDSISLNPDTVVATTKMIASVEQKVMMERLAKAAEK
ncbi:MAG: phosphoenolpyruvate synthase [Thermoplasmata archaeon]|nr:MAG: phosphoenolpyruvate synthase [Thermoplasmata archaeon]